MGGGRTPSLGRALLGKPRELGWNIFRKDAWKTGCTSISLGDLSRKAPGETICSTLMGQGNVVLFLKAQLLPFSNVACQA